MPSRTPCAALTTEAVLPFERRNRRCRRSRSSRCGQPLLECGRGCAEKECSRSGECRADKIAAGDRRVESEGPGFVVHRARPIGDFFVILECYSNTLRVSSVNGRSRLSSFTRRLFIGGLASVPVWSSRVLADETPTVSSQFRRTPPPVTSADQVVNVMEFEPLARMRCRPLISAISRRGRTTIARSSAITRPISQYEIRARRFNDLSQWTRPARYSALRGPARSTSPPSRPCAHSPRGRTRRRRALPNTLHAIDVVDGASTAVEAINEARGAPIWQQLYPTDDWSVTSGIVRRAEGAGCTAIVLTVDSPPRRPEHRDSGARHAADNRHCVDCHRATPMTRGVRARCLPALTSHGSPALPHRISAGFLDRVRSMVKGRMIVKGMVTGEDAALAVEHGADAIVVSNHGGRNEETLRAQLDCLPEVVAAVKGRVPIFVDGGIRRGTESSKPSRSARPRWASAGLRPGGWRPSVTGVEAVIDILNRELEGHHAPSRYTNPCEHYAASIWCVRGIAQLGKIRGERARRAHCKRYTNWLTDTPKRKLWGGGLLR